MKKRIILMSLIFSTLSNIFSQSNDYTPLWQEVDSLLGQVLPESAETKVKDIITKAVNEKNLAQEVKGRLYLAAITVENEENGFEITVIQLTELTKQKAPVNRIAASYLAEYYLRYFQNNRYEINERTIQTNPPKDLDVKYWDSQMFIQKISSLYQFSIEDAVGTDLPSTNFGPILNSTEDVAYEFMPTLYELLVDRALDFYSQDISDLPTNPLSFSITDPKALGSLTDFLAYKPVTDDIISHKYQLVLALQKVLTRLSGSNNVDALAYFDLARIKYMNPHLVHIDKTNLYLTSLENGATRHAKSNYAGEYMLELASHHQYNNSDLSHNVKCIQWAEKIIAKYPKSTAAAKAQNIINIVKKPAVNINCEHVYPQKQALLMLINHNNVTNLTLKIKKIDIETSKALARQNEDSRAKLESYRVVSTQSLTLKQSMLYESQKTEIMVEALPEGVYAIELTSGDDVYQFTTFIVSDIAFTTYNIKGKRHFYVADRTTGKPLAKAKIELYVVQYAIYNEPPTKTKLNTIYTDKKGHATYSIQNGGNLAPVIYYGKSVFDTNFSYGDYYGESDDFTQKFAEIYTDRSIYRPGQTVYFKAILMSNKIGDKPKVLAGEKVSISFNSTYDAISKLELTSNEWGAINGQFTIPNGGLTGSFSININNKNGLSGYRPVQVEEYKRPTYTVKADDIKATYKLGDKITVTGTAMTLAGTSVANADVKYSIKRGVRYNYWHYDRYGMGNEAILATGTTKTDAEGKYSITFDALGDPTITEKSAVTNFNIEVDVTDSRGESRSTNHSISLSQHRYSLSTDLPLESDVSNLKPFHLRATNANGQAVDAKANISIIKLQEPSQPQITRYWEGIINVPLPSDVYRKSFGQYPIPSAKPFYENWPDERKIANIDAMTNKDLALPTGLSAGVYKIISTSRDQDGNDITQTQYMVITDHKAKKFPKTSFVHHRSSHDKVAPGDKITIDLGTSVPNVFVHFLVSHKGEVWSDETVKIKNSHKLSIETKGKNDGTIKIDYVYFIQNRMYTSTINIPIVDPKDELKIEYVTFRDKTLPGSQEKYSLKLTNKKGEPIKADVLAAMYDSSLDAFMPQSWRHQFEAGDNYWINFEQVYFGWQQGLYYTDGIYDYEEFKELNIPKLISLPVYLVLASYDYEAGNNGRMHSRQAPTSMMKSASAREESAEGSTAVLQDSSAAGPPPTTTSAPVTPPPPPPSRTNLKETVFFYPSMVTNADGTMSYEFTINEALTTWRLMTLAHTKEMNTAYDERMVITQKNIMVMPNLPRFMREGDKIELSTRVENTTDKPLSGFVTLSFFDAVTGKDITKELMPNTLAKQIDLAPKGAKTVSWSIDAPNPKYGAIKYRIEAQAGGHTDGEENILPILTNKILVTESMPMWVRGNETKVFDFKSFASQISTTRSDQSFGVEFTAHPIWFAIQAMPYVAGNQSITTDALAEKLYTNQLAAHIVAQNPKVKQVFEQWKASDPSAFVSQLEKNPQLRNVILEETPWVLNARSESEQRRNIALLFDVNNMVNEQNEIIRQLEQRQGSDGGFPWFNGGRSDEYTTSNILELIGRLQYLGVKMNDDQKLKNMMVKMQSYLDNAIDTRYKRLLESIKKNGGKLEDDHLDHLSIHQLYTKSYFKNWKPNKESETAYTYYLQQAKKYWTKQTITTQAMIGLTMHRSEQSDASGAIIKSLRERKTTNPEMGTYWNMGNGYSWQDLPISRQAMLISLFSEASYNMNEIDDMKIWLLKQKQTNHWKSNKATIDAIHALLLHAEKGSKAMALDNANLPSIQINNTSLYADNEGVQAGTGYIYRAFDPPLSKDLSKITVNNPNSNIAWGAAYYQYLEQTDKVKAFADTPLKLRKEYFVIDKSIAGERIVPLKDQILAPGTKVRVRIELTVDRTMEYIHMKDQRPSGFEPVNVISEYKYQGGLSYYEVTKDVATHFYFSYLQKGSYVFEYDMDIVHKGDYTGGITSIESMYAPEFKSHSNGTRIVVK